MSIAELEALVAKAQARFDAVQYGATLSMFSSAHADYVQAKRDLRTAEDTLMMAKRKQT